MGEQLQASPITEQDFSNLQSELTIMIFMNVSKPEFNLVFY